MNPFPSLREYEAYIYTLQQRHPIIQQSTLVLVPRGSRVAVLQGELFFPAGFRITVKERLSLEANALQIEFYGYEVWCDAEKIGWYDAQPHPNDPSLAATFPHHKHIHPHIKQNRVPAPGMSFSPPNLPLLIAEIEGLIAAQTDV
jgi:hypothetical protein